MFHMPLPALLVPVLFIALFIALWMGLMKFMRKLMHMNDTVPPSAGERIDASRWGSAMVNGGRAKNCIRLERYATGLALRMHPVFGSGRIWLPAGDTEREDLDHGRLGLRHGRHHIILEPPLGAFVTESSASASAHAVLSSRAEHGPGIGAAPQLRREPGSALGRVAIAVVVMLLVYVLARRLAPELTAPIDAWLNGLTL